MSISISTKSRYALRLLINIAENEDRPTKIREVSLAEEVSAKYLEQIVVELKKNGYLKSSRGPNGGYRLAKPSDRITVGEIIKVMDGPFSTQCVQSGGSSCPRSPICKTYPLWKKLNEVVESVVYNISIKDLIEGNL